MIAAKRQIKSKPPPPVANVTGEKTEVKDEEETGTQKRQQSSSNFR